MRMCGGPGKAYIASWTFPSLNPPITRESIYDANDVDCIHLKRLFSTSASVCAHKLDVHKS